MVLLKEKVPPLAGIAGFAGTLVLGWYIVALAKGFVFPATGWRGEGIHAARYFFAAGLLILPLVLFIQSRIQKKPASEVNPRNLQSLILTLIVAGIFLAIVFTLRNIEIAWRDYDKAGITIAAYSASRFILIFYLIILCFLVGARFLRTVIRGFTPEDAGDGAAYFILCFFSGVALYGITISVIGSLGMLHFHMALLMTLPVLVFGTGDIQQGMNLLGHSLSSWSKSQGRLSTSMGFLLLWTALGAGALLVASKALYPGSLDNDVWEHYLPYYREVLQLGSTAPNAIWLKFIESKGAGILFLAGLLSDPMASGLVSSVFVLMAAIILFHLLRYVLKDVHWALMGVILFFAAYNGEFHKHHVVFTGFAAFLVWSAIRLSEREGRHIRASFWAVLSVAAYLPYSHLQGGVIFSVFFGLMGLLALIRLERAAAKRFLFISFVVLMSSFLTLAINYHVSGFILHLPFYALWPLANQDKVLEVMGGSGILYFLGQQARADAVDFGQLFHWNMYWIQMVYRLPRFANFFPPILLLLGLVVFLWKCYASGIKGTFHRYSKLMTVFAVFLIPIFIVGQVWTIGAVSRLYVFTVFFVTVIYVVLIKSVIDALTLRSIKAAFLSAFFILLSLTATAQAVQNVGGKRLQSMGKFLSGQSSFAAALEETDTHFPWPVKLSMIYRLRQIIGPETKIFNFGYDPGPAYLYPGAGIISEPTYDLGPDHEEMLFGEPQRAKSILQDMGINYFILNIKSELFTSLAYSRLFRAGTLNRYFQLFMHDKESFVLTWKSPDNRESLPAILIQVLELKQQEIFYYPFSQMMRNQLEDQIPYVLGRKDKIMDENGAVSPERLSFELAQSVSELMRREMWSPLAVEENRNTVRYVASVLIPHLERRILKLIRDAQSEGRLKSLDQASLSIFLNEELADTVSAASLKAYEKVLGKGKARVLTNDYRPHHYRAYSKSREDYRRTLRGEKNKY